MRNFISFIIIITFEFNLCAQIQGEEKVWESTAEPEQTTLQKEEGKYKNGKKEGLWKTYHIERNDLKSIGYYKNGKKNGVWKTFHWHEKIESIGEYLDDAKNGIWKTYLSNNQIKSVKKYQNSILTEYTYYSDEGYIYSITRYKDNKSFVELFDKDGQIKGYEEYENTGKKTGIWKLYDRGGISAIEEYVDGELIISKQYFSNNNLSIVEKYLNNKLNDRKQFWENGNLKYDFKYDSTILVSTSAYYENGQLQEFAEYKNGKLYNKISLFSPNGEKLEIGTFKNGNGISYQYDMQGKLAREYEFKDGEIIKTKKMN